MNEKQKRNWLETIIKRITELPGILQHKIILQLMIGCGVAIVSIGMTISIKKVDNLVGLLIAAFLFYNALNIVSAYEKGKVVRRKVICIGISQSVIQTVFQKDKVKVIFRDLEPIDGGTKTYEMNVTVSKKQRGLICLGAVLDIYFWSHNTVEPIAWEVVDFRQSTN